MHPIIGEESYSIGREAIINALKHSEGLNIEVEICAKTPHYDSNIQGSRPFLLLAGNDLVRS